MKKLIITRRISQLFFLSLFIYILWSTTYPLKGMLHPAILFKLDPLIMIMASISERAFISGTLLSLSMLVLAIIGGRFFCGWICPLGAIIDAAGSLTKKIIPEKDSINNTIHPIKSLILGIIFLFALFSLQEAWLLDPIVIMARFVSMNLIPFVTSTLTYIFILLIERFGSQGSIGDVYHSMKASVLGVKVAYFSHSLLIFALFAAILAATLLMKRFWCRAICPLGALYSLVSRHAMVGRKVTACVKCQKCKSRCRMGAIKDDLSYKKGECILCMDCVYDCPTHKTSFSVTGPVDVPPVITDKPPDSIINSVIARRVNFSSSPDEAILPIVNACHKGKDCFGLRPRNDTRSSPQAKLSRRGFLLFLLTPLFLTGFKSNIKTDETKPVNEDAEPGDDGIIRPPAAIDEKDFLNRCVRCGNCMKVCPTNGLQPLSAKEGYAAMWTPHLVPEKGYCEYKCTLCGNTCPTGAIKRITASEKLRTKLGTAVIDQELCIAWAENKECIVCEEHCPVYDKAIKLKEETVDGVRVLKPYVDEYLCVGCGICQNKCPTSPVRAIRVQSKNSYGL